MGDARVGREGGRGVTDARRTRRNRREAEAVLEGGRARDEGVESEFFCISVGRCQGERGFRQSQSLVVCGFGLVAIWVSWLVGFSR